MGQQCNSLFNITSLKNSRPISVLYFLHSCVFSEAQKQYKCTNSGGSFVSHAALLVHLVALYMPAKAEIWPIKIGFGHWNWSENGQLLFLVVHK